MRPQVININSLFDWTEETKLIWDQFDWDRLRKASTPEIPLKEWENRRNELGFVGLVSSLIIDRSWRIPEWEKESNENNESEHPFFKYWRDRQKNKHRENDNQISRARHFSGEEPFFRSPQVEKQGIVECYGIYVDDGLAFLKRIGLQDKSPAVKCSSAIFLCPERILEIYPTILSLGEDMRHPLPLSSNPGFVNLRMLLLHELGHHFFPVHRAGEGRFMSEGLANLFCFQGLEPDYQAWLLYMTWFLQPPEYSAYRPLNVLFDADSDCRGTLTDSFYGTLDEWVSLPKKDSHLLQRNLGASLTMALAVDAPALDGLWQYELQKLVSDDNQWLIHTENMFSCRLYRKNSGHIPADLVLDLYQKNDLASWTTKRGLPDRFWTKWAYGNDTRWPHDCIQIPEKDIKRWIEFYASSSNLGLASVICMKLALLLKGMPVDRLRNTLEPAFNRALQVASDEKADWFNRVPAFEFIEACSETRAIPVLENVVTAIEKSWTYEKDVHQAAVRALENLRNLEKKSRKLNASRK